MIGETVYLDGRFLPLAEARISPMDRGFLFGDGAYEVIPVYSRHPFRLAEHMARFRYSLEGIRLDDPQTLHDWINVIEKLIASAPWEDQGVYLQVTRGVDSKRDHPFPQKTVPTVFAMTMPLWAPAESIRESGVSAITAPDQRWSRCDLKTTALLANVLLRQESADQGCAETILLRDGYLTEGTASSILVVRSGTLMAPPPGPLILPGITCEVVLDLARQHSLPVEIRPISEADLRSADEIWLTSSTKEILAVTQLDQWPVGNGIPGPISREMWFWYQEFKERVMRHGAD